MGALCSEMSKTCTGDSCITGAPCLFLGPDQKQAHLFKPHGKLGLQYIKNSFAYPLSTKRPVTSQLLML